MSSERLPEPVEKRDGCKRRIHLNPSGRLSELASNTCYTVLNKKVLTLAEILKNTIAADDTADDQVGVIEYRGLHYS